MGGIPRPPGGGIMPFGGGMPGMPGMGGIPGRAGIPKGGGGTPRTHVSMIFSRKDGVERAGEGQTYLLGMGMVEEHERLGSVRA